MLYKSVGFRRNRFPLCEHQFSGIDRCEVLSVSVSVVVALRPILSVGGSSVILLQVVLGAKSREDDLIMNDDHCKARRIDNTHDLYIIQVGGPQLQSIVPMMLDLNCDTKTKQLNYFQNRQRMNCLSRLDLSIVQRWL